MIRLGGLLLLAWMLSSCATHGDKADMLDDGANAVAIHAFSGRLLVLNPKHRWQFEVDWQGDEQQGDLRITHAASGRVMYVRWQDARMMMLDSSQSPVWKPLSVAALLEMGVMLPPWTLARVFLGKLPDTMLYKGKGTWQGYWDASYLRIRWTNARQRLELLDIKHGRKVVLLLEEVRGKDD